MRYVPFWLILLLTALLWVVSSLSDSATYEYNVSLRWQGYDTAAYLIASADTKAQVAVTCSGWRNLTYQRQFRKHMVMISAGHDTMLLASDLATMIEEQLGVHSENKIEVREPSVAMRLEARLKKAFVPQLRDVSFVFEPPYGLYGQPEVKPDTVWLYGSASSLAKISRLTTKPYTINDITTTATYSLALDPVWQRYPDLRVSTTDIQLNVPTARYCELRYTLPIKVTDYHQKGALRLYPDKADVVVWVPEQFRVQLTQDMLQLTVSLASDVSDGNAVPIRLTRFPSYARVKQVVPNQASYVIINN